MRHQPLSRYAAQAVGKGNRYSVEEYQAHISRRLSQDTVLYTAASWKRWVEEVRARIGQ